MPLHLTLPEPWWFWLLVSGLAAFRITSVLHGERIGKPFRGLFGAVESDEAVLYPDTFFGHLIECFWCLSFWVSLFVLGIWIIWPWALLPFAISALAILFRKLAD